MKIGPFFLVFVVAGFIWMLNCMGNVPSQTDNKAILYNAAPQYQDQKNNISFVDPCPQAYRITSKFGSRIDPITGKRSTHHGLDISVNKGENCLGFSVVAADSGTVVNAYKHSYSGNIIVIKHDSTYSTSYQHLRSFSVKVGDTVKQGDEIAKLGNSGTGSTGPHLHFEIIKDGTQIDPQQYIRR